MRKSFEPPLVLGLLLAGGGPADARTAPPAAAPFVYTALGDSTGVGVGAREGGYVAHLFKELSAVRRGARLQNLCRSGATTSGVLADQAPRVPSGPTGVVTIGVGTNDLSRQVPPQVFAERLEAIVRTVRARTSAPVLLSNLPDVSLAPVIPPVLRPAAALQVRSYNEEIARVGARHGVPVIDVYNASRKEIPAHPEFFSRDGFHPSDDGYRFWAEVMWPGVQAALAASASPSGAGASP